MNKMWKQWLSPTVRLSWSVPLQSANRPGGYMTHLSTATVWDYLLFLRTSCGWLIKISNYKSIELEGLIQSTQTMAVFPICTSGYTKSLWQKAVITVIAIPNTIMALIYLIFLWVVCAHYALGLEEQQGADVNWKLACSYMVAVVAVDSSWWFPTCERLPKGQTLTRLHITVIHPRHGPLIWDRNILVAFKKAVSEACSNRWEVRGTWKERRRRKEQNDLKETFCIIIYL